MMSAAFVICSPFILNAKALRCNAPRTVWPHWSAVRPRTFDIVIADIKMPKLDGIGLLHRVREFAPETIFIMITAFASL